MVVTQPRRIAAISIAERVAYEQLLDTTGGQIGYKVRMESSQSEKTQLMFMTPGVLLKQLQWDPWLQEYTIVIMDEVHERDQYQEFLLIVLRDLLPQRPDLRLVLMSATIQTHLLVEYFMGSNGCDPSRVTPALVEMQGRMFPVQEFWLEHVLDMTGYITVTVDESDGAIGTATAPQMTDDQLEAELAKLTTQASLTTQRQTAKVHPKMQCVLCRRKNFKDAVELGTHLALCDGGGADDAGLNEEVDNKASSVPSFGGSDVKLSPQDIATDLLQSSEFQDYDVDDEYELEDFDYEFRDPDANDSGSDDNSNTHDTELEEAGSEKKWDGISPFHLSSHEGPCLNGVGDDVVLTKREEAILKEYQGMHNDEQIDNFLLLETIRYINQSSYGDGAILVFLPGWQEISELSVLLESTPPFSNRNKFWILPLHSGIPSKDQRRVLQRPPTGIRKIVLSTNVSSILPKVHSSRIDIRSSASSGIFNRSWLRRV
jgi:HrpA-like RNA helicase